MVVLKHFSRQFHQLPEEMKCLQLNNYAASASSANATLLTATPRVLKPNEILVKVKAASVNPFDIEMLRGYGRTAINFLRRRANAHEFPLILGRDCSGEIVATGKHFHRYPLGSEVYCVRWVVGQGTHAEYVVCQKNEISLKPKNISHTEASSFPYVACTTWNALLNSGAIPLNKTTPLRVFIPAGSGGVGAFAAQFCQVLGHEVITSCSKDNIPLLNNVGLYNVLDYNSNTFYKDLHAAGPFDVILDTLNEEYKNEFMNVLKRQHSSKYVSLRPSLLSEIDRNGLAVGLATSGYSYLKSTACQLATGQGFYHWGFVRPDNYVLDRIRDFIERGEIKPVIDRVFSIDDQVAPYKYVEEGHAKGKTIITF